MAPPQNVGEAIRVAQRIVQEDFTLTTNKAGKALLSEEQSYLTIFNSKWRWFSGPLYNQVIWLMVALFKASGKTSEELSKNQVSQ